MIKLLIALTLLFCGALPAQQSTRLGTTLFWALWAYKYDQAKLARNLTYLKNQGVDYIRVLGSVGCAGPGLAACAGANQDVDWWEGVEIDPLWPDYESLVANMTDDIYERFGIKIQWTLMGDTQLNLPTPQVRLAQVERFLRLSRGREHKIEHFEIVNEAWMNGMSQEEARQLAEHMQSKTRIPVASTSPIPYPDEGCTSLTSHSLGATHALTTIHFSRYVRGPEGLYKAVTDPWENYRKCPYVPELASNNEPIGPGASEASDPDPLRIVAAAISSYMAGMKYYVFHNKAGIFGNERDAENLYSYHNFYTALNAMKGFLPSDINSWQRFETGELGHPFVVYGNSQPNQNVLPGATNGVIRSYVNIKDNRFLALKVGIQNSVYLNPRTDMGFHVLNPLTGQIITSASHRAGQTFTLQVPPDLHTVVLIGDLGTLQPPGISQSGSSGRIPFPNRLSVVQQVARDRENWLLDSCEREGGTSDFLYEVVRRLRTEDPRWGFNWKRGIVGDRSEDVITYVYGPEATNYEGRTDVYIIDIIGGHCPGPGDADPTPVWRDVTEATIIGGTVGKWTLDRLGPGTVTARQPEGPTPAGNFLESINCVISAGADSCYGGVRWVVRNPTGREGVRARLRGSVEHAAYCLPGSSECLGLISTPGIYEVGLFADQNDPQSQMLAHTTVTVSKN